MMAMASGTVSLALFLVADSWSSSARRWTTACWSVTGLSRVSGVAATPYAFAVAASASVDQYDDATGGLEIADKGIDGPCRQHILARSVVEDADHALQASAEPSGGGDLQAEDQRVEAIASFEPGRLADCLPPLKQRFRETLVVVLRDSSPNRSSAIPLNWAATRPCTRAAAHPCTLSCRRRPSL